MPLYELQFERSPFPLYNLLIVASFQSCRTNYTSHICNTSSNSWVLMLCPPYIKTSEGRLSERRIFEIRGGRQFSRECSIRLRSFKFLIANPTPLGARSNAGFPDQKYVQSKRASRARYKSAAKFPAASQVCLANCGDVDIITGEFTESAVLRSGYLLLSLSNSVLTFHVAILILF
ncbi:unnamed protein product [Arctia plantaginis]|uniref:Uncharacterized protein n=1 Tax=Arctia plantaginis TaxID=874455 RepID=A0A8S1BAP9_ARCPL|nr:unnamed protein product [Arctia plantaginis]